MEIISKSASEPQHKPEHVITRYNVWHQRAKWHNTTPGRKEDREGRGEGRKKRREGKREMRKQREYKIGERGEKGWENTEERGERHEGNNLGERREGNEWTKKEGRRARGERRQVNRTRDTEDEEK